ncbi:MAG TPA: hypothetical protein VL133_15515 [Devosia sp.]|nr:hypothetical protein [Devosia sp.]
MFLPDRKVLTGMALGALCAMGIGVIGPGAIIAAIADEAPVGIDASSLVKFDGRDYDVQYDDWVDTTPTNKARIKKIEFGRVSYVDITTTSTGTYSTDAMFSDNIQYPGISVADGSAQADGIISVLGIGHNWVPLALTRGNSFVHIRAHNHATISGNGVTCAFMTYSTSC